MSKDPVVPPSPIAIVPVDAVEALIAENRSELESRQRELDEALAAAEEAERRLEHLPIEILQDDALRGEVLAGITGHVEDVERDRTAATPAKTVDAVALLPPPTDRPNRPPPPERGGRMLRLPPTLLLVAVAAVVVVATVLVYIR